MDNLVSILEKCDHPKISAIVTPLRVERDASMILLETKKEDAAALIVFRYEARSRFFVNGYVLCPTGEVRPVFVATYATFDTMTIRRGAGDPLVDIVSDISDMVSRAFRSDDSLLESTGALGRFCDFSTILRDGDLMTLLADKYTGQCEHTIFRGAVAHL